MEFDCISLLEEHLHELSCSDIEAEKKKATLLNYWVKDYLYFLKNEDKTPVYKYKRGSIIQADLGFRIGHEHGGRHYCVVLNSNYFQNTGLLTVVPLSSINNLTKKIHFTNVFMGNELKEILLEKLTKLLDKTTLNLLNNQKLLDIWSDLNDAWKSGDCEELIEFFTTICEEPIYDFLVDIAKVEFAYFIDTTSVKLKNTEILRGMSFIDLSKLFKTNKLHTIIERLVRTEEILADTESLKKQIDNINKMKDSSKALVDQIMTISSIRVNDPITSRCTLDNILISDETLDNIDRKIRELFMKEMKKELT